MSHTDIVSVILPVYNGEKFVGRAIESVLDQTYEGLELIVVDDGSSDNSLDVVQSYTDSRLKLFKKTNGGPASARNFGIKHSFGEFIALIDQDDLWYPEKLEKQIILLSQNSKLGMVYCDALSVYEDGSGPTSKWSELHVPQTGKVFIDLYQGNFILSSSAIFRKSLIHKIGLVDEDKKYFGVDDYECWLRIALNSEIGYVPEILVERRLHKSNLSFRNKKSQAMMYTNAIEVRKKYNKLYPNIFLKRYLSNSYLSQVNDLLYNRLIAQTLKNLLYAFLVDKANFKNIFSTIGSIFTKICNKIIPPTGQQN